MKKIILTLFFAVLMLAPFTIVKAAGPFGQALTDLGTVNSGVGLATDFKVTVATVIQGALSLVGTIFLILAVYAGILWMTASGNEEKVTKAKDIITQAVLGLAITLAAYAITYFVTTKLSGTSNTPCETQYAGKNPMCKDTKSCVAPQTSTGGLCPGTATSIQCCHD